MILGEIIIDQKLKENILIKKIKDKILLKIKTENNLNPQIPTQIIGWNKVKEICGEEVSILNKTIKKNLYWTFEPNEKLQDFNEDIIKFLNYLYGDFIEKISYEFIDPVINKIKNFDDFLNKFNLNKIDSTYFTDDFIYLFIKENNKVYGLDIKYNKVLKIDNISLINNIKKNSIIISLETYELETSIYQKYKKIFDKEIDKKYIPVFECELNKTI